jgi:hypothetical protein
MEGLVDESRRPQTSPVEVSAQLATKIVELRHTHPRWGARKLQRLITRQHEAATPSISTVTRVLEKHGCLKRRRRRPGPKRLPQVGRPTPTIEGPNDVWTVDFKGWWRTADGAKCEPLTVRDAFSRYVLAIRLLPDTTGGTVRREFEHLADHVEETLPGAPQNRARTNLYKGEVPKAAPATSYVGEVADQAGEVWDWVSNKARDAGKKASTVASLLLLGGGIAAAWKAVDYFATRERNRLNASLEHAAATRVVP